MSASHSKPDFVTTTLRREIGLELNRILELPDPASHARRVIQGIEGKNYESLAQPFRDSGAAFVEKGRSYEWIEEHIAHVLHLLLKNYGPSWERSTGDGEQLIALLARPQTEALWAAQKEIAHRTNLPPANNANTWQGLQFEFQALRNEELSVDPGNKADHWLRAFSNANAMEWHLSKGISENFHKRLELLATRAGNALGPAPGTTKLNHWLYRLYLELKKGRGKLLLGCPYEETRKCNGDGKEFYRQEEGGIIVSVSEASATYCAHLAREAIENSVGTQTEGGLIHSPDYRSVTIDDVRYSLSPHQALIFEELHLAYKQGLIGCSNEYLLSRLGSPNSRLRDSFKSARWSATMGTSDCESSKK